MAVLQAVWVCLLRRDSGSQGDVTEEPVELRCAESRPLLGEEQITRSILGALGQVRLEHANLVEQGTVVAFVLGQWLYRPQRALDAVDLYLPVLHVQVRQLEPADFTGAHTVPVRHQDRSVVTRRSRLRNPQDGQDLINPNPPRDWLRRLERQQSTLADQEQEIANREFELNNKDTDLEEKELGLIDREYRLEKHARQRVQEILKSKTEIQGLIRAASRDAVKRSRATLLGRLLERMAPCFRKVAYDPRDMRSICDPFDYVLFDGLTVERQVKEIVFIEVKCGRGPLSGVQRGVVQCVDQQKVHSEVWEIGDPDVPITRQLMHSTRRALPPTNEEGEQAE